jgi:carboxyl-terminal processing protease
MGGAFSGGVVVGWMVPIQGRVSTSTPIMSAPKVDPAATPGGAPTEAAKPVDAQTLFKPFWTAWDLVHQQYVDQPVDDVALMRGAIKGMIESLGDQHSSYMDPKIYTEATADLTGKTYDGIGAWVDVTGQYLKITSPMPNSPAQKAGIKTGDLIIAVDKEDMTGIPGDVVLKRVLGQAGTTVTLTVVRKGADKPFDIVVTRAKITVPQVDGKMLDNQIAYVRLYTFGDQTTPELRRYLKDLLAQNPKGLILDLRNNGGGWLDTAITVVSEFIKSPNVVMYEQFGDGTRTTYKAKSGGLATDIPLVVLVNEGTASASEITAGAIQDWGRGKLVGAKTYGKGSVQHISELKDDGGAVRITVARWLTPKERQIHKLGLTPDVVVPISDDDVKNDRDPQLDKAVEILTSGLP